MKLKDKVAIVTGGGRGIGKEIALLFAKEGAKLAISARSLDQVAEVAKEIESSGGQALAIAADVSNQNDVQKMVDRTIEKFGKTDILVNNAGINNVGPFVTFEADRWREVIEINLTGVFYCTRAVVPHLLENGWGRIINIASRSGKIGIPFQTAYCASKHGVVGLTKSLAEEMAAFNITVNAICPALVDTGFVPEAARDRIVGKIIQPSQIAATALHLAEEQSGAINGEAINIFGNNRLDYSM